MNRKFKIALLFGFIIAQVLIHRYADVMKLNIDLFYLILVYISVKTSVLKTIFSATLIGWITDFFSGGVIGVFGFSRVCAAFFIHEVAPYLDLTRSRFVFLLIAISLSLSNLIANLFFHFIYGFDFELNLILNQPLFTGLLGVLLVIFPRVREKLDVY